MKQSSLLSVKRPVYLLILFGVLIIFMLFNRSFTTSGDVVPVAVWQDKDAQSTFKQVIAAERDGSSPSLFTRKAEKGFSGGYTTDAFWMRFIVPASSQSKQIYLEVQPTYLDYVYLYWPDDHGNFQEIQLGDRLPFNQRLVHSRGFVFPVELGSVEKTAYLRLQTSSTSLVLLKTWQPEAFHRKKQSEYFLFALMIGIGVSLVFFNSLQVFGQKSLMYYAFIFFLVVQLTAILVINGFASEFIFPNSPAIDSALVGVVTMLLLTTISLGHYFFLRLSWQETPILFALTWGGVALAFIGALGVFLNYYVDMMPKLALYVILLYVSWILFGLKRIQQRDPYAHWVVFASVAGIFSSVAMILVLLGWFSVELVGLYAYQVGSIAAIFAFQVIISGHIKDALQKNKQLTIDLFTQHRLLQQEQTIKQKQSQFIAMLTHEIKTPLSIIQIALSQFTHRLQPHALTAAQDIIKILDCCLISEKLEAKAVEVRIEPIALGQWFVEFLPQMQDDNKRLIIQSAVSSDLLVLADPVYLKIVLSNLIENALKYSPKASLVNLTLFKVNSESGVSEIALQVSNEISKAALPDADRLFEKYYRAPESHRVSGSGIGLYLVKELSQYMQIKVIYTHNETEVFFTVYFPIMQIGGEDETIIG